MQPKLPIKKIFLGVVALVAVIFFAGYAGQYVFKSKAAGEVVTFTSNKTTANTVAIVVSAPQGKGISGVTVALAASGAKITNISLPVPLDPGNPSVFTAVQQTPSSDGGYIMTATNTQIDDRLPQIVSMNATVSCTSGQAVTLKYDTSRLEVTGNISADDYGIVGADTPITFVCDSGSSGTTQPSVNAHFSPKTISSTVGSSFSTDFIMDGQPAGKAISSFDATIKYDPRLVEATNIGELSTDSLFSLLGGSAVNAPSTCSSDDDCRICAGTSTTMCKQGTCKELQSAINGGGASVMACDFTNATPPDMSCRTRDDCLNKFAGSGMCENISGECPITCTAAGQCGQCTPGVNCTTSSPVPTSPSGNLPLPTTPPDSSGKCDRVVATNDTTTGTIRIVYLCSMPSSQLPTSPSISLIFKSKAAGSGALHIDSSSEIAGNIDGNGYVVNAEDAQYTITAANAEPTSPASGPTPTTAPGGGNGNVTLNLKLKFQGIEKKPADPYNTYMVKCSIGGRGNEEPVEATAEFKANDSGVWSGTLQYDEAVELGTGKKIFCKGPKHMQKKICDNAPTETFPGTYNPNCDVSGVTLVEGENNLDFSGIRLLVGDLPPQDGIANSADMSLIIKFFDQTTPEAIRAADLNGDGAVNAYDYSFMAGAFAHHLDDL